MGRGLEDPRPMIAGEGPARQGRTRRRGPLGAGAGRESSWQPARVALGCCLPACLRGRGMRVVQVVPAGAARTHSGPPDQALVAADTWRQRAGGAGRPLPWRCAGREMRNPAHPGDQRHQARQFGIGSKQGGPRRGGRAGLCLGARMEGERRLFSAGASLASGVEEEPVCPPRPQPPDRSASRLPSQGAPSPG